MYSASFGIRGLEVNVYSLRHVGIELDLFNLPSSNILPLLLGTREEMALLYYTYCYSILSTDQIFADFCTVNVIPGRGGYVKTK